MNSFDEHIRNRISEMRVEPSPEIASQLRSAYPKPGIRHLIRRPWFGAVAGLMLAFGVFVAVSVMDTDTPEYQVADYHLNDYDHLDTDGDVPIVLHDAHPEEIPGGNVLSDDSPGIRVYEKYTYGKFIAIETGDRDVVSLSADGLSHQKGDDRYVFTAEKPGVYPVAIRYVGQPLDSLYLHFVTPPGIFDNSDTVICGKQAVFASRSEGEWISSEGLVSSALNGSIEISAADYGEYWLVRRETDNIGSYSDSLIIRFIPSSVLEYQILESPLCYGDNARVKIISDNLEAVSLVMEGGKVNYLTDGEFEVVFNQTPHSASRVCYIQLNDGKCRILDSIVFDVPAMPEYEFDVHPETCDQPGAIELISHDADECMVFCGGILMEDKRIQDLDAGRYLMKVVSASGCEYEEEVEVASTRIINADFDIQISMDGLSARTINKTSGTDEFSAELSYQWYVNGELQSETESPELSLTSISNTIRLIVNYGQFCSDEHVMSDVKPDKELIRCPNIFTPNGDGQFDYFKVILDPRLTDFRAVISSRSGQLVYEWTDPDQAWDGRYLNGQNASEAVYFYIIQARDYTGKPIEKRGTIQLIRD